MGFSFLKAALVGAVVLGSMAATAALAQDKPIVGLITKTEGNPFFVKMREGAQAEADKLGLTLKTYAGKFDGDNDSQVAAIEDLISSGAKGFAELPERLLGDRANHRQRATSGSCSVIDLDTPTDPINAVDATFATDNFKAGNLIGSRAKCATFAGDKASDRQDRLPRPRRPTRPTVDVICATRGFMHELRDRKKQVILLKIR